LRYTINGKKTYIRRKDFFVFAEGCGLPKTSAEKMIAKIVSLKPKYQELCDNSLLSQPLKVAI